MVFISNCYCCMHLGCGIVQCLSADQHYSETSHPEEAEGLYKVTELEANSANTVHYFDRQISGAANEHLAAEAANQVRSNNNLISSVLSINVWSCPLYILYFGVVRLPVKH